MLSLDYRQRKTSKPESRENIYVTVVNQGKP